jgi:flagellin-specific chaperone FliS
LFAADEVYCLILFDGSANMRFCEKIDVAFQILTVCQFFFLQYCNGGDLADYLHGLFHWILFFVLHVVLRNRADEWLF